MPDVYVEESHPRPPIEGVAMDGAAFVGPTAGGAVAMPVLVTGLVEYEEAFGDGTDLASGPDHVWYAARAFFAQGGRRLHVVRVADQGGPAAYAEALAALEDVDGIGAVAAPGANVDRALGDAVDALLVDHAERTRSRLALLDAGPGVGVADVRARRARLDSSMAAMYHPWARVARADGAGAVDVAPTGFVAGIYARVDAARGVWHAPANERLVGALGLVTMLDTATAQALTSEGVNTLRRLPGRGLVVWGARTTSGDPEWRYVNVRRFLVFLERSLDRGLQWAVFEPNDEPTWQRVTDHVREFLLTLWRDGAMRGTTPDEAFFVRCDRSTMTQADIDDGRLVVLVGVAPLKPAEFVILRIGIRTVAP